MAAYQEALSERDASLLDEGVIEDMKERLEEHIAKLRKRIRIMKGNLSVPFIIANIFPILNLTKN